MAAIEQRLKVLEEIQSNKIKQVTNAYSKIDSKIVIDYWKDNGCPDALSPRDDMTESQRFLLTTMNELLVDV